MESPARSERVYPDLNAMLSAAESTDTSGELEPASMLKVQLDAGAVRLVGSAVASEGSSGNRYFIQLYEPWLRCWREAGKGCLVSKGESILLK